MKPNTIAIIISLLVLTLSGLALYNGIQAQKSSNEEIERMVNERMDKIFEKVEERAEEENKANTVKANFI